MNIDAINDGIVIDHIRAGRGMELYRLLNLDKLDCQVAIINNAVSAKLGRKDIIKVAAAIDLDMDVLGYADPDVTVNIIRGGELVDKRSITTPEELRNVLFCKNPRCITSIEQELPQVFRLANREKRVYRCAYCDSEARAPQ